MPDRIAGGKKKFSSVVDVVCDEIKQLETTVRVLKNKEAVGRVNLKELESKRDTLSKEIYGLEKEKKAVIKETQEEKEKILASAQEKLQNATAKETEASGKLSALNKREKEADDIVKSNQGLQENLNRQKENIENKIMKLKGLIGTIQSTLQNL